jgi:Transposase, Mutator family
MAELRVNDDRLWQSVMTMAEIGVTAKGGVNRVTYEVLCQGLEGVLPAELTSPARWSTPDAASCDDQESTGKVAIALLPVLGRQVSPTTVSAVAKQLDSAVAAFHRRPLKDQYRVLVLDGVVLKRKTGAGALARPVLVALGLRPDGKKEVIDFRLASAESAAQWEQFLGDLVRRGLHGERLEMLCVDGLPDRSGVGAPLPNPTGQSGLLAALPTAYPDIPVQRAPLRADHRGRRWEPGAGRTRSATC